jgi:hypothetical protein
MLSHIEAPCFSAVQRMTLMAHRCVRCAAIFSDAIGGIADIDRPQVLDRSVANDP